MYLENKVGVVDFTKACGLGKFQSLWGLVGPWNLKHYHSLGVYKIYYSHFIFEVMYQSVLVTFLFFFRNVFIVQRCYFPKQVWMR
jgi:hypothetical protein